MSGLWLQDFSARLGELGLTSRLQLQLGQVPLLTGAALAVTLLLGLLAMHLHRRSARPRHDLDLIPGPWRSALPLLGNILEVLTPDFHRKTLQWADEHGGFTRIKVLWRDAVMVTDPEAVATICGRGPGSLDKASAMYFPINQMCEPAGHANLLTSPSDERWKAVRKAVAAAFSVHHIKAKLPVVVASTDELVGRLRALGPQASVDVDQAALRVTLDVIGLAGFGHDYGSVALDSVPSDHLLRVLPRCFTEVMLRIANPARGLLPWLFRNGNKGVRSFRSFQAEMQLLLDQMISRGPPAADDFSIAAQLYRVRGVAGVDDARLLSEIGILFVEGFETTGHTISWTLFNVATVPGVQDKIAAELDAAGLLSSPSRPSPRQLALEDLKALPYLAAATKEAMRMYPVVSVGNGRVTSKPTQVGPYLLPAGVVVGTPLFALHNTKHNWERPLEFLPERWLAVPVESYVLDGRALGAGGAGGSGAAAAGAPAGEDDSEERQGSPARRRPASGSTSHSRRSSSDSGSGSDKPAAGGGSVQQLAAGSKRAVSYMPFSEGPRNCVGQSLAKMEVLVVLAKLLAAFRVELAPEMGGREGIRARESTHLTLQTKGTQGIRMRMVPRESIVAEQQQLWSCVAVP